MRAHARHMFTWFGAVLLLVATAAFAGAQPARGRMFGATDPESARRSASRYRVLGQLAPADFLKVRVVDGVLEAGLVADLPVETVRVAVEGSDATWVCRQRPVGVGTSFSVMRYDFDAPPDRPWSVVLTTRPDYLTVTGQYANPGGNGGIWVRMTQTNGAVVWTCANANGDRIDPFFEATGSSLREFQAEHPAEVRKYLAPLLKGLGERAALKPEPGDVYRAFDAIRPDPAVVRRLDELLVRLASDDYAERERATRELAALGPPSVLAAVRRDVSDLEPEVRNRLAQFVEAQSSLSPEELELALRDGSFLLECLDDADVDVRTAAKGAIEKRLGRRVTFDPSLSGERRVTAIDELRRQVASELSKKAAPKPPGSEP